MLILSVTLCVNTIIEIAGKFQVLFGLTMMTVKINFEIC